MPCFQKATNKKYSKQANIPDSYFVFKKSDSNLRNIVDRG